jgi:hypothetical protein
MAGMGALRKVRRAGDAHGPLVRGRELNGELFEVFVVGDVGGDGVADDGSAFLPVFGGPFFEELVVCLGGFGLGD